MSRYIQVLNAVKNNLTRISLTSGQTSCRTKILERLEYPGVINLYGRHGVGKTTLGWCLENENHLLYLEHPSRLHTISQESLTDSSIIVFIDNASHQHHQFRAILDELTRHRIQRAVVSSNQRVEDYVQGFHLDFALTDADTIIENFSRLGFSTPSPQDDSPYLNLWEILQYNVRRQYHAK